MTRRQKTAYEIEWGVKPSPHHDLNFDLPGVPPAKREQVRPGSRGLSDKPRNVLRRQQRAARIDSAGS
jgi:hypothetical protein